MGQVTIYLEAELEEKLRRFVQAKGISLDKWIAELVREKLQNEWPETVLALAGAWEDFPSAEEIRTEMGTDRAREPFE